MSVLEQLEDELRPLKLSLVLYRADDWIGFFMALLALSPLCVRATVFSGRSTAGAALNAKLQMFVRCLAVLLHRCMPLRC